VKRYIVSLVVLFVIYNVQAMELFLEDNAKVVRIAKLFNKYPHGYGENNEKKQETSNQMVIFSQDKKYKFLYAHVKKCQNILKNMEVEEIWYFMCNDSSLISDVKQKIYFYALWDDAKQYYAMDTAFEFLDVWNQPLVNPNVDNFMSDCNVEQECNYAKSLLPQFKDYFLSEIDKDNCYNIAFSKQGECDISYPLDDSPVKSQYIFTSNGKELYSDENSYFTENYYFTRKTIRDLVLFINDDTKANRINKFKNLLNNRVKQISDIIDKEKNSVKFIELLVQLKGHDNKEVDINNCKVSRCTAKYIVLPLEEILSAKNAKIEFDPINPHTPLVEAYIKEENISKKSQSYEKLFTILNSRNMVCSFIVAKCLLFASLPIKFFGLIMHGLRMLFLDTCGRFKKRCI